MQKLYRTDYEGEFVVDGFVLYQGKRTENRIFVPNTLVNNAHTKNAVIIGNGTSRKSLDVKKIEKHRGGHLGRRRLQSYGCNALYRDMSPDFLVCINPYLINEIVKSGYADKHIVMSNASNVKTHPGVLHLFPYGHTWCAGALATWLACFDGHQKIYLLGFDNQNEHSNNNVYAGTAHYATADTPARSQKWEGQMKRIFDTYDDVEFCLITGGLTIVPDEWKYCTNLTEKTMHDFVLSVDL